MKTFLLALVVSTVAVGTLSGVAAGTGSWKTFGEGTLRIGKDVSPGTYRSRGGDGCYWARLRSFSGSVSAIIANANAAGPTIVTIGRSDRGFDSSGCGTWTSNLGRITKSTTNFGQGAFIVRTDIAPGTYRSRGGDGCYWARLRSFSGSVSAIIANSNPAGSTIVTIGRGDRGFESSGCANWARF